MVGFFSHNLDLLGLFYGGNYNVLVSQLIGVVIVVGWAILCAFTLFFILKRTVGIRVSRKEEEIGLDFFEHGEKPNN